MCYISVDKGRPDEMKVWEMLEDLKLMEFD